jgi:hypothetical protein
MIVEWIAAGAAFGIKAFFAVFIFLLCCLIVLGLMAIVSYAMRGGEDDLRGD